jgi:hypothetical protein
MDESTSSEQAPPATSSEQAPPATISGQTPPAVAPGPVNAIASLYKDHLLSCLDDLAYLVAKDFFANPRLYKKLADKPADELKEAERIAKLRARLGTEETIPSKEQREELFDPLFTSARPVERDGQPNGQRLIEGDGQPNARVNYGWDFVWDRDNLMSAVTALTENLFEKSERTLRERVLATVRPVRANLIQLQGASTNWRKAALDDYHNNIVYPILRNKGVAARFGVAAPGANWPNEEDPNGDMLASEIAKQLSYRGEGEQPLTPQYFNTLQRVALTGQAAIDTVIRFGSSGGPSADNVIDAVYLWNGSLRDVQRGWVAPTPPLVELTSSMAAPSQNAAERPWNMAEHP